MAGIYTFAMEANTQHRKTLADAERWLVRLKATDCSADERLAFERWRAEPRHAAAFASAEALWHSVDGLRGNPVFEGLSQRAWNETAPSSGRGRISWPMALAASMGLLVVGIAATLVARSWLSDSVYVTEAGERSTVKLPDGSEVILNAATKLKVQYRDNRRHFVLSKGEALFSVAQDSNRPFTVAAGDSEVAALGTEFQVRAESQQVRVTLLSGLVAVERQGGTESVQLKPGEQVRLSVGVPGMDRRTVDPEVAASWSTGRLVFRATPLEDVVDEVNRYSNLQIRISDSSLNSTPVSGTFEIGNSASVVSSLQALFPIDGAQRSSREIWLVRRP